MNWRGQRERDGLRKIHHFRRAAYRMMEKAEYTMSRFAKMYGMTYVGMATNEKEAKNLSGKI